MFKDKGGAYTFVPDGPAEVRVDSKLMVHKLYSPSTDGHIFNSPQQILLDNVIVRIGISV